jgi:hypothetical protein
MKTVIQEIWDERIRQVFDENFSPEWDDEQKNAQLARGAACYALGRDDAVIVAMGCDVPVWPWDKEWFKPSDPRRNLIKAGALIVAEIERLDRAEQN